MADGRATGPRIVAGELRGRRLRSARGEALRPTAERTREAIFSMLGPVDGLSALDLFCGTGALGIEALSRGAARVTLVDERAETAASNVEMLAIDDRCTVVEADAIDYLARMPGHADLVFCDPPYRLADRLASQLDNVLPPRLAAGGRVVFESDPQAAPLGSLPLLRERRYGAALVRIYGAPDA